MKELYFFLVFSLTLSSDVDNEQTITCSLLDSSGNSNELAVNEYYSISVNTNGYSLLTMSEPLQRAFYLRAQIKDIQPSQG